MSALAGRVGVARPASGGQGRGNANHQAVRRGRRDADPRPRRGGAPRTTAADRPDVAGGAVTCAGPDLRTAAKPPVLLVHGTFVTDEPWRGGAYEALQAARYPTCLAHVAN